MINKKVMTAILDVKLTNLVMEFKEFGCTVLKEKQEDGRWSICVSFSEDSCE